MHRLFNLVATVVGCGVLGVAALTAAPPALSTPEQGAGAPQCAPSTTLVRIPELPEASGIAVSRRTPGRLWAHNDSGEPVILALDSRGVVTSRVRLSGATVEDWESIAAGPCPGGSCLYVADIGDNDAERKHVTVYRVPEPGAEKNVTVQEAFHATYPDGAHDAETLLVAPDGRLFIVTKGDTGAIGLYRFPRELTAGRTHRLERVSVRGGSAKIPAADRITDGDISPDGTWVVLRTTRHLAFHRASELLSGTWTEARRVDLTPAGEAQGEGIALAADGTIYLAGEGGKKALPGTFTRLNCGTRMAN